MVLGRYGFVASRRGRRSGPRSVDDEGTRRGGRGQTAPAPIRRLTGKPVVDLALVPVRLEIVVRKVLWGGPFAVLEQVTPVRQGSAKHDGVLAFQRLSLLHVFFGKNGENVARLPVQELGSILFIFEPVVAPDANLVSNVGIKIADEVFVLMPEVEGKVPQVESTVVVEIVSVKVVVEVLPADRLLHPPHVRLVLLADGVGRVLDLSCIPEPHVSLLLGILHYARCEAAVLGAEDGLNRLAWL